MGKAPLILQYLHDHARLICDRKNIEDGEGSWRITALPDEMRRNIIFHYGTSEPYDDFFNQIQTPKLKNKNDGYIPEDEHDPLLDKEIDLKAIERRDLMRPVRRKPLPRLSIPRKLVNEGIFSKCIQGLEVEIKDPPKEQESEQDQYLVQHRESSESERHLSSSPILKEHNDDVYFHSSDYENDLFNEPDDLEMAQFHHQRDINISTNNHQSYFTDFDREFDDSLNSPLDYNNFPLNSYQNSNTSFHNNNNNNHNKSQSHPQRPYTAFMYNNPVFNASYWNESNYTDKTDSNKRIVQNQNTSNDNNYYTLKFNSQPNGHFYY